MTLNVKFLYPMNLLGSINMSNYDLITFYLPQLHKWPPFKSSLSPLSSSSLTQHQVPKYAKQHIAMILSDFRGLNSLFNSILPLKTNAVAIRDSIFHATEAKQFSLSLIPGTSLCKVSVTQSKSMNIEDPDGCFPRRFLTQNFTLSGSPFQLSETSKNYTFYNCSKEKSYEYAAPVSCLSGDNFTVLVTFNPESELQQQCQEIMYAPIDEVELSWFEPGCGVCVRGSQECALMSDDSLEVGCFDVATATPSNGMFTSFLHQNILFFFPF